MCNRGNCNHQPTASLTHSPRSIKGTVKRGSGSRLSRRSRNNELATKFWRTAVRWEEKAVGARGSSRSIDQPVRAIVFSTSQWPSEGADKGGWRRWAADYGLAVVVVMPGGMDRS